MTAFFFYGTLRHRPMLELLAGGRVDGEGREAVLPGHRVLRSRQGDLPLLVEDAGSSVVGTLWTGLGQEAIERLDAYELPFGYTRRSVTAIVGGEPFEAQAYYPPSTIPASSDDWSFENWLRYAPRLPSRPASEDASREATLGAGEGRAQSPMSAHRAAASARAGGEPVTVRRRATVGDFELRRAKPPAGSFFRFETLEVGHRRFDGRRADGLQRECLVGADASLVLPYDAARDRVLLVEQFRTGPARRGDPQPWVLEPVAGLVDADETPEQAARREAMEEAGVAFRQVIPMFAGYASPGNSTDHFYLFLGLCDLPDDHATHGGLAAEDEDLRLHLLDFDAALALVDSGEANVVPVAAMLLWLDRWRSRRRV